MPIINPTLPVQCVLTSLSPAQSLVYSTIQDSTCYLPLCPASSTVIL